MILAYLSYAIYLCLIIMVIMKVGHQLHSVGERFIQFFFPEETSRSKQINDLLLLGFYLVNIGYSVIALTLGGDDLTNLQACVEWILTKVGVIVLILGGLHINNMVLISLAHRLKRIAI